SYSMSVILFLSDGSVHYLHLHSFPTRRSSDLLMSDRNEKSQKVIRLGTHGEDYGNWMSDPVFYMVCGLTALAALLAVLSFAVLRSEEHTSELQSRFDLVCRLLLEKKN